jgi:hypothetical protein
MGGVNRGIQLVRKLLFYRWVRSGENNFPPFWLRLSSIIAGGHVKKVKFTPENK